MFSLKSNIKKKLNDLKRVDKKNLFRKFIDIICGDNKDIAGKYYKHAFLHLKRWRGIATRYVKRSLSFLAAVQIRCISLWAEII